jgi:hypothetical protein
VQINIKEAVSRSCCHPEKDLQPLHRSQYERSDMKFCIHCGRQWTIRRWSDDQIKAEAVVRGLSDKHDLFLLLAAKRQYGGESLEPQRLPWESDYEIKRLLYQVSQHVKYSGAYEQVPDEWR